MTKEIKLDNPKVILKTYQDNGEERKKIVLPLVSDEELWERYKLVKPLVKDDNKLFHLKVYNIEMLRHQSFIWNSKNDLAEQVDPSKVKELDEFPCYHSYGYYGLFKPTIAEVLQQFPDDILLEANAFYISKFPQSMQELKEQEDIINLGCHKTKVKALLIKK